MFTFPDLFSVAGRTALVTGGASGLGQVCAEALLSAGAVLIASRKVDVCEQVAAELSAIGPCQGFGGTVASEAGWRRSRTRFADAPACRTFCQQRGGELGEPFERFPWKASTVCSHLGRSAWDNFYGNSLARFLL